MRSRSIAIAVFFALLCLGEIYGHNQVKTADDYLDQAELIIKNENYMPLLENKKGEKDKFLQLVNQSLQLEESARAFLFRIC